MLKHIIGAGADHFQRGRSKLGSMDMAILPAVRPTDAPSRLAGEGLADRRLPEAGERTRHAHEKGRHEAPFGCCGCRVKGCLVVELLGIIKTRSRGVVLISK